MSNNKWELVGTQRGDLWNTTTWRLEIDQGYLYRVTTEQAVPAGFPPIFYESMSFVPWREPK